MKRKGTEAFVKTQYGAMLLVASLTYIDANAATQYSLGINSSSFMRSSQDRATQSYTVQVGVSAQGENRWMGGALDLQAGAFTEEINAFGIAAKNAYIHTASDFSSLHRLSLGRKWSEWSVADESWKLGVWSPRYLWDPLHPTTEGKVGFFYTYGSRLWNIEGLVTPLSLPETGAPVRESDGTLHAPGPFWIPMRDTVAFQGRTLPLRYDMALPPLGDLILKPNAALKLRYGAGQGGWASLAYGYQPLHIADIAANGRIDLSQGAWVQTTIHPSFPYRHLMTAETGYIGSHFWLWGSVTSEHPEREQVDPNWVRAPMGRAWIGTTGIGARPSRRFEMSASYVKVTESAEATEAKSFDLEVPSRFAYLQAARIEGRWNSSAKTSVGSSYILDIDRISSLVSIDFRYQPSRSWRMGIGADGIISGSSQGTIGQYVGDDRIRWSIDYVF